MTAQDRRLTRRFALEREVYYRVLEPRHSNPLQVGRLIDMSSKGVRFCPVAPIAKGKRLEIQIDWPATLDNKCRLKLIARARVVRSDANSVSAVVEKHEFRTAGRLHTPPPAVNPPAPPVQRSA